jgi:hypothetical protein
MCNMSVGSSINYCDLKLFKYICRRVAYFGRFRKISIKGCEVYIYQKISMVDDMWDDIYINIDNKDEIQNIFKSYEINFDIEQKDVHFASEMIQDICEEYQHLNNVDLVFKRFLFILLNEKKS